MTRRYVGAVLTAVLALSTGACEDPLNIEGPFDLVFRADDTFQAPHGGQTVRVAVVLAETDEVVVQDQATVATDGFQSFQFVFPDLMQENAVYQIHYWIDSNFDDGNADVCDEPTDDHQWWFQLQPAARNLVVNETHRPAEIDGTCDTFAAHLTFEGDASFQTAHGGQTVHAAVVRTGDGAVLWRQQTTVSGTEDPSFVFEFPGALLYDDAFEVHYWIDSNFAGGTQGTCDPPANDHQWAVDIGQPTAPEVFVEDTHRPTETEDVCATFQ